MRTFEKVEFRWLSGLRARSSSGKPPACDPLRGFLGRSEVNDRIEPELLQRLAVELRFAATALQSCHGRREKGVEKERHFGRARSGNSRELFLHRRCRIALSASKFSRMQCSSSSRSRVIPVATDSANPARARSSNRQFRGSNRLQIPCARPTHETARHSTCIRPPAPSPDSRLAR